MNGAADKVAFVFEAVADVPDAVSFYVSSYTSSGTIDATLETLASDGTPSGTPVTNSGTASVTVSGTGVQTTATGIAGTATLTEGDLYAIVLTATTGFAGNFIIQYEQGTLGNKGLPYALTKDSAGAWTKTGGGTTGALLGFKHSGGSYFFVPGYAGAYSCALQAFSDSTNPDERGNRFSFPVPVTVYGALCYHTGGSTPGNNDAYDVVLYTTPTSGVTEQRRKSFDGDASMAGLEHKIRFASSYDVPANMVFGLALKATGTETQSMPRWDYPANAHLAGFLGVDCYSITRNNSTGDFTSDDAKVYGILPLISKLDDGAGGGGGGLIAHPGMRGGFL